MFAYLIVKTQQVPSWSGWFQSLQKFGLMVNTEDAWQAFINRFANKAKNEMESNA